MFTADYRNLGFDCLVRSAAIAVLLHALVIGPLLVQCIPPDGSSLVELIGYDPCHHAQPVRADFSLPETGFTAGEEGNSCVDLMMDNPGVTQVGMEPFSGADAGMIAEHANFARFSEPLIFTSYRLARGPGIVSPATPTPVLSLRI
jgi:hypothetical protein